MALYAYSSTPQAVPAGSSIALAQAVRRGRSATLSGLGVALNAPNSPYEVAVSVTGTTTAAGELSVAAYVDGVAVPGAAATQEVAAAGDAASVAFSFIYVTPPQACCDPPTVTLVNAGGAGTVTNASVTVHRLS